MREQLVHDKEAWEAEKRADERRKEEEQERLRATFYWKDLRAEQRCLRYGARRYSARVANVPREYDPVQACKETAVEIHGWRYPVRRGARTRAVAVFLDTGRSIIWSRPVNPILMTSMTKAARPQDLVEEFVFISLLMIIAILNMFHQHIESRLWNLQSEDDWRDMCSTTPANFRGLHLDSPEICENWGIRGVWGYWNIEDPACL
ncbi:hypothetical protein C8J57DRAFT_457833 [Mycena rebaudengoi]|nr:hypothetical protein C8J57DRAFT_457833 [Mycena rebaudengoi]